MTITKKIIRVGLKFGIIAGIFQVLNVYILTFLGLGLTYWVFFIGLALLLFFVYKAHISFKLNNQGRLTIKSALLISLIIVFVSTFIQQLNMVIYTSLDPNWVEMVLEMRKQSMIESGLSQANVELKITSLKKAFRPVRMLTRGVLIPGMYSFIIASFVMFFTRSSKKIK